MARDTYLDHLQQVPLFSTLSKKELRQVASLSTELDFQDGKELISEGAHDAALLIVVKGSAIVRRNGRKVATLGPGDFAGELALLTKQERNATVVADGSITALVVDARSFRQLLDEVPAVTKKMLYVVAERLSGISKSPN